MPGCSLVLQLLWECMEAWRKQATLALSCDALNTNSVN